LRLPSQKYQSEEPSVAFLSQSVGIPDLSKLSLNYFGFSRQRWNFDFDRGKASSVSLRSLPDNLFHQFDWNLFEVRFELDHETLWNTSAR